MKKNLFVKILLLSFLFFFPLNSVLSQDTVQVTIPDTLSTLPSKLVNFEDNFLEKTLSDFTSEPKVDSSVLQNFITKDFSDYLKPFRQLEILSYGPVSQAKYLRFLGIPSERVGIFYDDNSFNLQSLYIPQSGDVELQILPLENINSVQLIDNGLANLIESGGYSAGLFLKQKDYVSGEPFSKLQFDQGIKGYRRAQVELGRPLFQNRLRFYLTAGFKKYSGDADNTDQDLDNFTGKFSYDLSSTSKVVLNGSFYEGKRGVRGFPGWEVLGIRKNDKISNWSLDYYRKILQDKTFKLKLRYNYSFQNLKPMDWDLKNQTGILKAEIYPETLSKFSWKASADFKYDRMKEFERHIRWRGNFNFGTLWKIAPNFNHLAWVNFVKTQTFKPDVTAITGFSWKPDPKWKIFVLGSRNIFYPTLFDLDFTTHKLPSYITIAGNQNLLPQRSLGFNGGFSHLAAGIDLGLFFYYERIDNFYSWRKIATKFDSLGNLLSYDYGPYPYILKTNSPLGLTFFLRQATFSHFRFNFKFNLQGTSFDNYPFFSSYLGFLLLEFNQSMFNEALKLKINLENNFIEEREDEEHKRLPRTVVLNGKAGLRIKDFFIFYALENITNQTYRTFGDFNMPKRSNFWGVSWEFRD